jgi:hypothetical protein
MERALENAHSLAQKTGGPQPTIRRIALGPSRDPHYNSLNPLVDFLGIDVAAFHDDATSMPNRSTTRLAMVLNQN